MLLPLVGIEPITVHPSSFGLSITGIGFLGTALAYFLWNAGIHLTSANHAGIFINMVPLSAASFSILFGETLYGYHFISGVFIIVGALVIMTTLESPIKLNYNK